MTESFPNGAGYRPELEDVWPLEEVTEDEDVISNADQVRTYLNKESNRSLIFWFAIAGVIILLYAMHGDSQALANGFIH